MDLCWLPLLSRQVDRRCLEEFFDLVPFTKLVWGGDAYRADEAYAAACWVREVLAEVLAQRIEQGDMDRAMADTCWDLVLLSPFPGSRG